MAPLVPKAANVQLPPMATLSVLSLSTLKAPLPWAVSPPEKLLNELESWKLLVEPGSLTTTANWPVQSMLPIPPLSLVFNVNTAPGRLLVTSPVPMELLEIKILTRVWV